MGIEKSKALKIAILIAHAEREPFQSLRSKIDKMITNTYKEAGLDTYFISARKLRKFEVRLRDKVECLRWSKLFPVLRIYDGLALRKYKKEVAPYQVDGNDIRVNMPEDIRHLTPKLLSGLEFMSKEKYDWVIRTTLYSVINPTRLIAELNSVKVGNPIIGGRKVNQKDGTFFISGSFMYFNRQAIIEILANLRLINFGIIDDVSLTNFAKLRDFEFRFSPSIDVRSKNELQKLNSEKVNEICHVRCRSAYKNERDQEILIDFLIKHYGSHRDNSEHP